MIEIKVNPYIINECYRPYIANDAETLIIYGGPGSGKSFFIAQRALLRLLMGGRNILIVRKIAATLRNSTFALLMSLIRQWNIASLVKVNLTELSITCANGYKLLHAGLDDVDKLKSITAEKGVITDIWIEEATETVEQDYNQLMLRLRGPSEVKKQIVMSFNPISCNHWIKKRFFDRQSENVAILRTTHRDNAYMTKQDRANIEHLKEVDPAYYAIYALGEWGALKGTVFDNWEVAILNKNEYNNRRSGLS